MIYFTMITDISEKVMKVLNPNVLTIEEILLRREKYWEDNTTGHLSKYDNCIVNYQYSNIPSIALIVYINNITELQIKISVQCLIFPPWDPTMLMTPRMSGCSVRSTVLHWELRVRTVVNLRQSPCQRWDVGCGKIQYNTTGCIPMTSSGTLVDPVTDTFQLPRELRYLWSSLSSLSSDLLTFCWSWSLTIRPCQYNILYNNWQSNSLYLCLSKCIDVNWRQILIPRTENRKLLRSFVIQTTTRTNILLPFKPILQNFWNVHLLKNYY